MKSGSTFMFPLGWTVTPDDDLQNDVNMLTG